MRSFRTKTLCVSLFLLQCAQNYAAERFEKVYVTRAAISFEAGKIFVQLSDSKVEVNTVRSDKKGLYILLPLASKLDPEIERRWKDREVLEYQTEYRKKRQEEMRRKKEKERLEWEQQWRDENIRKK